MPVFGHSHKTHVTSSCHDEHGMRNLTDPEVMHKYVMNPIKKICDHRDDIVQVEADYDGADLAIISYGTVSRSARAAAAIAREAGLKVGTLRLITCWPLPDKEIRRAAESVKQILVLENNNSQVFPYIKAQAAHACPVEFLGPEKLGQIHDPAYVLSRVKEMIA